MILIVIIFIWYNSTTHDMPQPKKNPEHLPELVIILRQIQRVEDPYASRIARSIGRKIHSLNTDLMTLKDEGWVETEKVRGSPKKTLRPNYRPALERNLAMKKVVATLKGETNNEMTQLLQKFRTSFDITDHLSGATIEQFEKEIALRVGLACEIVEEEPSYGKSYRLDPEINDLDDPAWIVTEETMRSIIDETANLHRGRLIQLRVDRDQPAPLFLEERPELYRTLFDETLLSGLE